MVRKKGAGMVIAAKWTLALLPLMALFAIALAGCDLFPEEAPEIPDWTPDAEFITLTEGVWANGNISSSGGKQWFKFTTTASTQYIHVIFGTLKDLDIQLYDNKGKTVSYSDRLRDYDTYLSRSVTSGKTYYIKVEPHSSYEKGTYQIAFNTSSNLPSGGWTPGADIVVTSLTEGVWADGNITSPGGKQWFSFTATTSTSNGQYIHVTFGTLTELYVRIWDSFGDAGYRSNLYNTSRSISRTLKSGETYYIEVEPYSNTESGDYRITFSSSSTPPVTWPPGNVTTPPLTESVWADGNVTTSGGEQWFSFTATTSTSNGQYIHVIFGTLTDLDVQLYDSDGKTVGSNTNLYSYGSTHYISRTVTSGQIYYIRIKPHSSYGSGTYRITFNTSSTRPVWAPLADVVTPLTTGVWTGGNIATADEEQWFSFTATTSTFNGQYMHVTFGTLDDFYVELYNSSGAMVGIRSNVYGSTRSTSRTVTSGQTYYIKVYSYGSRSGDYEITFNASSTRPVWTPSAVVTPLAVGVWANGNIATADGKQWFSFTATAYTQYIHVAFGTLDDFYVELYNNSGATVGSITPMYGSTRYASRTVTSGQTYYIKVYPFDSTDSGTYKIAFNTSTTPPAGP
jgi:predicted RNA-binding protein with TRAM domain